MYNTVKKKTEFQIKMYYIKLSVKKNMVCKAENSFYLLNNKCPRFIKH